MATKAKRYSAKTATTAALASYDSTKLNLGTMMRRETGSDAEDNWFGPFKPAIARPMEASTAIAMAYPHAIVPRAGKHWIFMGEISTAAATRRIVLYEYAVATNTYTWVGFITVTFPPNTNHTIRGLRAAYQTYTTGTVTNTGTAFTGSGTTWSDDRLCVGSRIGIGSTDPQLVTEWLPISAIGSNTSITVSTTPLSNYPPGTPYVIEDLRIAIVTTNATATNGGLFLVKGLNLANFSSAGSVIAAATNADNNAQACWWLADASTVVNTAAGGVALDDFVSWTEQYVYVVNATTGTQCRIFVYNIRAALTSVASGKTVSAFLHSTGIVTLTGTISQTNNGRIATCQHGPMSGVKSLYLVTTTRIYACQLTLLTNGGNTWGTNVMVEVPPGGSSTYPLTSVFTAIEYAGTIDRFFVTTTGANGVRSYVTQFRTDSGQMDHIFLVDDKQYDQTTADARGAIHPSIGANPFYVWIEDGIGHLCRGTTVALTNQMYSMPVAAHWQYADGTDQVVITPAIDTTEAVKLYNLAVNTTHYDGEDTFLCPTEPFAVDFRQTGISDNSGSWTELDRNFTLESVAPGSQIQFRFRFRVFGSFCIPSRVMSYSLLYEDATTHENFEPSIGESSVASAIFAWRQMDTFGGTLPELTIRLYNASTRSLIVEDNTTDQTDGTFEYSDDGGDTWAAWDDSVDVIGTYIRYTLASPPSGVRVAAVLQVL